MPRYKPYDYNQMLMLPLSLADQLAPGTLEYAIHHLMEERIDTSMFDEKYRNDETGRCAYDPKVLLKVVLFAYSRGILHSRRMERACRENITFMALTCGQAPDHSTLAAFVSSMGEERIVRLFTQVLLVCEEEGLLGGTHFSLDGLKLSSNASKEWSGKHVDLIKKKQKLEAKVKEAVREQQKEDIGGDDDQQRQQKRVRRLEKQAERIGKFLADNETKCGRRGKEIQSNVTDNESAKMVSSHGVVQGYNANAFVDEKHQVVVNAEAFGDGDDAANMGQMLEGAKVNLQVAGCGKEPLKDKVVSADTGYYSIDNLEACKEEKVDAYIPDREFRKRDPRFVEALRHRRSVDKQKQRYKSKKRWFSVEDFHMDERTGKLICPAGQWLYIRNRNFETEDGYKAIAYQAPKTACRNCKLRVKCLRNPKTVSRQVHVFYGHRPGSLADAMKQKIDTPVGRKMYGKRLAIVEPVFGNIRAQKGLDRFTLRGRGKVNIQWRLYCLVHNMEKILHFGTSFAKVA